MTRNSFPTFVCSPIYPFLCAVHLIFSKIEYISLVFIIPKLHNIQINCNVPCYTINLFQCLQTFSFTVLLRDLYSALSDYKSQPYSSSTISSQPYQVTQGSSREWRIICQGYYPDIHVLDAGSLELLYTLSSKVAPDWISALCVTRPLKRQGKSLSSKNIL